LSVSGDRPATGEASYLEAGGYVRRIPGSQLLMPLLVAAALVGCSDVSFYISTGGLADAPNIIIVSGKGFVLRASVVQSSGSAGGGTSELVVSADLEAADGGPVTEPLTADSLWLVRGDEVWAGALRAEPSEGESTAGGEPPLRLRFVSSGGPAWAPGEVVDVIVRVLAGGEERLLRQSDRKIQ
jgi:hypothetical protein